MYRFLWTYSLKYLYVLGRATEMCYDWNVNKLQAPQGGELRPLHLGVTFSKTLVFAWGWNSVHSYSFIFDLFLIHVTRKARISSGVYQSSKYYCKYLLLESSLNVFLVKYSASHGEFVSVTLELFEWVWLLFFFFFYRLLLQGRSNTRRKFKNWGRKRIPDCQRSRKKSTWYGFVVCRDSILSVLIP